MPPLSMTLAVTDVRDRVKELLARAAVPSALPAGGWEPGPGAGRLLGLGVRLYGAEAVDAVALHLALTALTCPRPDEHHQHHGSPVVHVPDARLLIAQDVDAGNRSVRGLARRYAHLDADRPTVRAVLWALVPEYYRDNAARHGPARVTIADPVGNRARARGDRRYALLTDADDRRARRIESAAAWPPGGW